jgi:hypothetical protein
MLYVSGVGKIVDGPFTPDDTSGDIVIRHKKGKFMQCISNNYITNQSLKGLKRGDTVIVEGVIDERELGYPIILLTRVEKGNNRTYAVPPPRPKRNKSEYPKVTIRRREDETR